MKQILIEYKLVDHTSKQKTKLCFWVEVQHDLAISQQHVDQIKQYIKGKIDGYLKANGYVFTCEHVTKHESSAVIDGVLTQTKFFKKCCYDYAKGKRPCEVGEVYKYKWVQGTHDHLVFDGRNLTPQQRDKLRSYVELVEQSQQVQKQGAPLDIRKLLETETVQQAVQQVAPSLTGGERVYKLKYI